MPKKRVRPSAVRQRTKPAHRWGAYLVAAMLLLLGVTVAAAQMSWASATPEPAAAPAVSNTSPAANSAQVSPAPAGDDGARTLNLYGGGMQPLVEERDGVQTLNIYGPGGQIIAQVVRDGQGSEEVRYLLTDHLGSTRVVLDSEGNAVARYEYAPHGETTAAGTVAGEVRYRYTGHPYDEGQEVYETPARGYDPTLGRFLSVDPLRVDASPYVYAGNNPVGYLDPAGGVKVPFFVNLGMDIISEHRIFHPISKLLAPENTPRANKAGEFKSFVSNKRRFGSAAAMHPEIILHGQGAKPIYRNNEVFWFITDKVEEGVPDDVAHGLERMRGIQNDFALNIVLLDFSETGKGDAIRKGIPEDFASITHIKAKLADNWGADKGTYTPGYEVGEEHYTAEGFVQYVRRRMSGQEVGATPLSTYQSDDVTRLDVPEATRGESTQFDVPTIIQMVEQDTKNISTPRSSTGHRGEPIDVAGFHEFPLMPEDYQTTHVDTDLLSALQRVPEGAWGMLDP